MTVERTNAYSGPLYGDGRVTKFPFDFNAASDEEVAIELDGFKVDPSLYVVSIDESGEGSVVFFTPPVGTIFIFSDPLFSQEVNFEDQGPFYQSSVNEPIDRSAIRDIVLRERVDRAIKVPFGGNPGRFSPDESGILAIFKGEVSLQPVLNIVATATPLYDDGVWNATDFFNIDGVWG